MDQPPSQFVLNTATAMMRWFWCGVCSGFGLWADEADGEMAIHHWISGIFRRLDEMLAQYRAGALASATSPREVMRDRKMVAEPLDVSPQAVRIVRPFAVRSLQTARQPPAGQIQRARMPCPKLQICTILCPSARVRRCERRAGASEFFNKWGGDWRESTPLSFRFVIESGAIPRELRL
jgi:hypothetical protein